MSNIESIEEVLNQVLDGTELKLKLDSYTLWENLETSELNVECKMHDQKSGAAQELKGEGKGLVDAVFRALRSNYSEEFQSLENIKFSHFSIQADINNQDNIVQKSYGASNTDSEATVYMKLLNSENKELGFSATSYSINRSSIDVVLQAFSFLINCERAFITLKKALDYAKKEGRLDSATLYTQQMAKLVEATSYSDVKFG